MDLVIFVIGKVMLIFGVLLTLIGMARLVTISIEMEELPYKERFSYKVFITGLSLYILLPMFICGIGVIIADLPETKFLDGASERIEQQIRMEHGCLLSNPKRG